MGLMMPLFVSLWAVVAIVSSCLTVIHDYQAILLLILQPAELEALVSKALRVALAEELYERGIVIDGLNSQYLSPDVAANLLLTCMGLQKSCKSSCAQSLFKFRIFYLPSKHLPLPLSVIIWLPRCQLPQYHICFTYRLCRQLT